VVRRQAGGIVAKKAATSLADWLNTRPNKHSKCPACLDRGVRAGIAEILDAIAQFKKHDVSLAEIRARLLETTPGAEAVSASCLRRHCAEHETKRWAAAKGKAR
jgi:hypothetical protein